MERPHKLLLTTVLVSAMILIGVGLVFWAMQNENDASVIDLPLDDGVALPVDFVNLTLLPGQSTEYTLRFSSYSSKQYTVSLDFFEDSEKKELNTLKHFVRVRIELDGELAYDELLEKMINDETIRFPVDVRTGKNTRVKIKYYLPESVGNEAKGATADFKLMVTAGNEDPAWDWD